MIRFAEAVARLDGDVELLREMAAITIEDFPAVQAGLEEAIARGDCDRAACSFHHMKGMLSTFESAGVTIDLQTMLDLASQGELDEARSLYRKKQPEIAQLVKQIESSLHVRS